MLVSQIFVVLHLAKNLLL